MPVIKDVKVESLEEIGKALESSLNDLFKTAIDISTPPEARKYNLLDWLKPGVLPVLKMPPGSGKTHIATQLVNKMFKEHGLPSIYFVLQHDVERAVEGRETWNHWYGHSQICDKAKEKEFYAVKGYNVSISCDCKYKEQFRIDVPTIAPIEYIFCDDLSVIWGDCLPEDLPLMRPEIHEFPLRIIDEIDFSRFVGKMEASLKEVQLIAKSHPQESIRFLCQSIAYLMDNLPLSPGRKTTNGRELYQNLENILKGKGSNLEKILSRLKELPKTFNLNPWLPDRNADSLPANFPPYLVPIIKGEIRCFLKNIPFNPRIHLRGTDNGSILGIRWRKYAPYIIPTIFLDATADPILLAKAFEIEEREFKSLSVDLPGNARIFQLVSDRLGKNSLGLYPYNKGRKSRLKWYKQIAKDLERYPKDPFIGLITFKEIENEAKEEIGRLIAVPVQSLHYYGLRSSNALEDCKVLILFGCPFPDFNDLIEAAQAFFESYIIYPDDKPEDLKPLDTGDAEIIEYLIMRDDRKIPVKIRGYKDPRLQAYFRQKCQMELYQAIHRCRPLRIAPDESRDILIYTNMPIPEVKIDGFLGWEGKAIEELQKLLQGAEQVSAPDLARELLQEGQKENSIERRIRRSAKKIAELTDLEWDGTHFRTKIYYTISKCPKFFPSI